MVAILQQKQHFPLHVSDAWYLFPWFELNIPVRCQSPLPVAPTGRRVLLVIRSAIDSCRYSCPSR